MKLTTEILKQIIKEELTSYLEEGKKYHKSAEGPIVIYYRDENPNPDEPNDDVEKGLKDIKDMRSKRGIDQSVPLDTSNPDFKKITSELSKAGYDFKIIGGDHKVKIPGGKDYVDYVLRFGRKQRG